MARKKDKQLCHGPRILCLPSENVQPVSFTQNHEETQHEKAWKDDILCWKLWDILSENNFLQQKTVFFHCLLSETYRLRLVSPNLANKSLTFYIAVEALLISYRFLYSHVLQVEAECIFLRSRQQYTRSIQVWYVSVFGRDTWTFIKPFQIVFLHFLHELLLSKY